MTWELRGKTVFVTGAARGIGAETARRVAAAGTHSVARTATANRRRI